MKSHGFSFKRGQTIVEYLLSTLVLAAGVLLVFGGFYLGDKQGKGSNLNIKASFDKAVDNAIGELNR